MLSADTTAGISHQKKFPHKTSADTFVFFLTKLGLLSNRGRPFTLADTVDREQGTMAPLLVQDTTHNDIMEHESSTVFSSSISSLMSTTTTSEQHNDAKDTTITVPKKKKAVQFSADSEVYDIPRLEDHDQGDLENAYLSERDHERITNENQYTLLAMNRGVYPDSEEEYFRGLEGGMQWFSLQRRRLVRATVSAILRAQKEQGRVLDASWVEHYYREMTAPSALNAIRVGAWDAQVARQILGNNLRIQQPLSV
jgi:hypothetical protein